MIYKSLIFASEPTERVMSKDVITDLKLDLILPSDVTDVFLYKPDGETLNLRRELFQHLLGRENAAEELDGVLKSLSVARELYTALNRAVSEPQSSFIFVFLFSALSEFCKKATVIKGAGALYRRFTDTLTELSVSEAFKNAENEAEDLTETLSKISQVVISTEGESSKVYRESESCISESLKACAAELGITLTAKKEKPLPLQKGIAEALEKLYPDEFSKAKEFYGNYRMLVQGDLFDYENELKFILGVLKFTETAAARGIPYSFPSVSDKKEIDFKNVYDVTLLKKEGTEIVPNDVSFNEKEPFFYLTGANGGGKTTYLRALGISVLFFLAGAPVFCDGGQATLLSSVFTHFPRDERFEGSGRFVDEVNRVNEILEKKDERSLILLNETYSTTGEEKAVAYTEELAKTLHSSGAFGVYITHQHSVSEEEIPFLSVVVDESDSNRRTYKIEKRRTESLSFAKDILKKHGLTGEALKKRFGIE